MNVTSLKLILLWRDYLLRKDNGLSIDDWKTLSTTQKESFNLMIKLWDEYQAKKDNVQALNTWKATLSESQQKILALLISMNK